MSSFRSTSRKNFRDKVKSQTGSEEGRLYEKISLVLLAKRGYELSKNYNYNFCNFAIGREVCIGKDGKFDDVVFSYIDQGNTKNLIFVQIKHKQDNNLIDSNVLSTEASRAKNVGGSDGGMCRDFNLQKYFISYLSVRDELNSTTSKKLKNGKLKYVVIFTNIGLDNEELKDKGFCLKEAIDDIVSLFNLKKLSPKTPTSSNCYQFRDISKDLSQILKKSSYLHRLAKELAQYVVWKDYRENKIMGIDETPVKHYHIALEREVIRKLDLVEKKSSGKQMKNERYCEVQFRDDFLDNDKIGSKLELRDALFQAIRELDESKKDVSDEELKRVLKVVKWKVVPNFGKSKQNIKTGLPSEWITVKEDDITDFLKCLVFIVNQPRVTELEALFKSSIQDVVVESTLLNQFLDKINSTGLEFRMCMEKAFGIDVKTKYKEMWISGDKVATFIEEKKQLVSISFVVSAMTLMYKNEVMQYGKFTDCGKITNILDNFFASNCSILCINSLSTLFTSIKILQNLHDEKHYNADNETISISMDILKCAENRESALKAFQLENNNLLIIEWRCTFEEKQIEGYFHKLFDVAKNNSSKKIILIQAKECARLMEKIITGFQEENLHVTENDFIDLKDFEPEEDPIRKDVLIFQGQKAKVSLATLTGISCWSSYVHYLSKETFLNNKDIIDVTMLVKILNNDEIEVGSKPMDSSSLDGAYAALFEEIDPETLANKLKSQVIYNDTYIISGIDVSNETGKVNRLIQCLGLINRQKEIEHQLGDIGSDSRIQIADDQFNEEDFKRICSKYPEKMVFWIHVKAKENEMKFILHQFYNPKFYLKRKFKQVIIKSEVKIELIKQRLYESFIFLCVSDQEDLIDSLKFTNETEKERFKNNCKNGKVRIFSSEDDAKSDFQSFCKRSQTVHWLKLEESKFIWFNSNGSIDTLRDYIDHDQSENVLVEEDNLIEEIKNRKEIVIADDPGMGKSTTLMKLCNSLIETHWIVAINLRDHLDGIKHLKSVNSNIDVVNFLSKVDAKLHNSLTQNLLEIALHKDKNFSRPLLLAFDGFDEILDGNDRKKIISLLKFLKEKTTTKIWVTTRLHFKETLENILSSFSIEFDPMNYNDKIAYVKKYLKDRLSLILKEEKTVELFSDAEEMPKSEIIQKFIEAFLIKMASVFKSNVDFEFEKKFRFIGTPLQLYLMLEGSVKHLKCWIENDTDKIPDFNYLGSDVREVYKAFIDRKYNIYFEKKGIKEHLEQKQKKGFLNQCNEGFAESLILNSKPKETLEKYKDMVLSAGIIKCHNSKMEYIHTSFRDYFAARVCIDWIKQPSDTLFNINVHEFVLKEILKKSDYQFIRAFINLELNDIIEAESFEESVKYYGIIVEKLFREEESSLIDEKGTMLHIAVEEGNTGITLFLLNSLKRHKDFLEKLLFMRAKYDTTVLHLACEKHDIETVKILLDAASRISEDTKKCKGIVKKFLFIPDRDERTSLHIACIGENDQLVRILLDAAEDISEDTLQEFIYILNAYGWISLDVAVIKNNNTQILKHLLNRAKNKLDLILSEGKISIDSSAFSVFPFRKHFKLRTKSSFSLACEYEKKEIVKCFLQEFETDENSVKQLLLHSYKFGNSLYWVIYNIKNLTTDNLNSIVEILLSAAKSVKDDNETLKKLLLPENAGNRPLTTAIERGYVDIVENLLIAAKSINDENYTLKQLLYNDKTQHSALWDAASLKYWYIMKLLIETAFAIGIEMLEKLIFAVNKNGKSAAYMMTYNLIDSDYIKLFEILEEHKFIGMQVKVMDYYFSNKLHTPYKYYESKHCMIFYVKQNMISSVRKLLENEKKSKNTRSILFLRLLLLAVVSERRRHNVLHTACVCGYTDLIKELLSYAVGINDEGATLEALITSPDVKNKTPFELLKNGYTHEIKEIMKNLIQEAKSNNNIHVVNILQGIDLKYESSSFHEFYIGSNSPKTFRGMTNLFKK